MILVDAISVFCPVQAFIVFIGVLEHCRGTTSLFHIGYEDDMAFITVGRSESIGICGLNRGGPGMRISKSGLARDTGFSVLRRYTSFNGITLCDGGRESIGRRTSRYGTIDVCADSLRVPSYHTSLGVAEQDASWMTDVVDCLRARTLATTSERNLAGFLALLEEISTLGCSSARKISIAIGDKQIEVLDIDPAADWVRTVDHLSRENWGTIGKCGV